MVPFILAAAGVHALAAAIPEKMVAIGPVLAKARTNLATTADVLLERAEGARYLDAIDAAEARKKADTLRRSARSGWSNRSEYAAAGIVAAGLVKAGITAARRISGDAIAGRAASA